MTDIEQYLEDLITKVCSDLASMYPRGELSEGLIFPHKRDGTLRISEQEAKFVFARHLTADRRLFCVEYPTLETYQQKGTTPMSARVDLTIIGDKRDAVAHVELKAHNCTYEAIRKDLEKLLREKTTGCWFHTLERADHQTLRALRAKFRRAFLALAEHFPKDRCAYVIAFFVLDAAHMESRWLRFTGNECEDRTMVDAAFSAEDIDPGWATSCFRKDIAAAPFVRIEDRPESVSRGKGVRRAFLALVPTVSIATFVHISVRGDSYRIRRYNLARPAERPKVSMIQKYATFKALLESGLVVQWIPLTDNDLRHNIDEETQYWCDRIRGIKLEHASSFCSTAGPTAEVVTPNT